MFDDKILEPFHQNNINEFIYNKKDFVYYIGAIPIFLLPYDLHNYRNMCSTGTHSVIYSKHFRERIKNITINDWDVYLNLHENRYIYYTPLCYQLFSETDNSNHWGDHHYILYFMGLIARIIVKIFGLDKSTDAYSFFYFVSKLWILLFLIIIWILLTFFTSLKM